MFIQSSILCKTSLNLVKPV